MKQKKYYFEDNKFVFLPEDYPQEKVDAALEAMRVEYKRLEAVGIDPKKGDFT